MTKIEEEAQLLADTGQPLSVSVLENVDDLVIAQDRNGLVRNFFRDFQMCDGGRSSEYLRLYNDRHQNEDDKRVDLSTVPGLEGVIPLGVTISAGAGHKVYLENIFASQRQTDLNRVYLHSPSSDFHGVGSSGPELRTITRIQQSPAASQIIMRVHEQEMKPYYPVMLEDLKYAIKESAEAKGDTIILNCTHPDAAKVAIKYERELKEVANGKKIVILLCVTDHVDHEIWKLPVDGIMAPDAITAKKIKTSMLEKLKDGRKELYELRPDWDGKLPEVVNLGGYPVKPGYVDKLTPEQYYKRRGRLGGSEDEPIRMVFRFGGASAQREMYATLIENLREYFPNYVPIVIIKDGNGDPSYLDYIKRLKAAGADVKEAHTDDELIDLYDTQVMDGNVDIVFTKASEQTSTLQLQSNEYGGALVAITGAVQDQEWKNMWHYQTKNGGEALLESGRHEDLYSFLRDYDHADDDRKRELQPEFEAWRARLQCLHGWINPQGENEDDTSDAARIIYLLHKHKMMRAMCDFVRSPSAEADVNPLSGDTFWKEAGKVVQRVKEKKKPDYQLKYETANQNVEEITIRLILERVPAAFRRETLGRDVKLITFELARYLWDRWQESRKN